MEKKDKFKVAEDQLVDAIRLFFDNGNSISIHTLARNSHEILDILCANKNLTRGVINEGLKDIDPKHHDVIKLKINEAKNFSKHADRDPDSILSWNPEVSKYFIWDAVSLYTRLVGWEKSPGEIISYGLWFRFKHQNLWVGRPSIDELIPDAQIELGTLTKKDFFKIAMRTWEEGSFRKIP